MTQATNVISGGAGVGGLSVRTAINAALAAIASGHSGATRPTYVVAGMIWVDTSVAGSLILKLYYGSGDATLATISTSTGAVVLAGIAPSLPQGRLTLATATPVMSSAQTAKTVVYYALYLGNQVPIYDGSSAFAMTTFAELQNDLTQSSTGKAGPAAATTNSNYDLFVWSNSGTLCLTRGPVWSSDTSRGAGAGTTELQRINGIWTNKVAITNGPGANLGTYVGTIRTDGSSQCNWNPTPAAASGGGAARLDVFNAWNRVKADAKSQDNTASWVYNTNTWRSLNNSTSNRISYIDGLGEVSIRVDLSIVCNPGGSNSGVGVNRDSTSATPSATASFLANQTAPGHCADDFQPSIGFHYLQAVEANSTGATNTFYGASPSATGGQAQSLSASMVI